MAIVCFWAAMMSLLLRREVFPEKPKIADADYSHMLGQRDVRHVEMGIYSQSYRIGSLVADTKRIEGGEFEYECEVRFTEFKSVMPRLKMLSNAEIDVFARASAISGLSRFEAELRAADMEPFKISAMPRGDDEIWVIIRHGEGQPETVKVPMSSKRVISSGIGPLSQIPKLGRNDVGRQWRMKMISPFTGRADDMVVKVVRRSLAMLGDQEVQAYQLEITVGKMLLKAWVDADGEVLVQETPFLVSLRRENPAVRIPDDENGEAGERD
ncbi:MAG TPA: hypothetical protein PL033_01235 [Candidatus Brocadiia bacterium]|nr:hypothetical protein [Candidatus Brocadiia bacterium]